jgi:hypothetical protein
MKHNLSYFFQVITLGNNFRYYDEAYNPRGINLFTVETELFSNQSLLNLLYILLTFWKGNKGKY